MLQAIHIRKQFQRSGEVLRDVSFTLGDGRVSLGHRPVRRRENHPVPHPEWNGAVQRR